MCRLDQLLRPAREADFRSRAGLSSWSSLHIDPQERTEMLVVVLHVDEESVRLKAGR